MRTTAAVLLEPNRIEIVDLEIPKLRPGQVLVQIDYSGVCGSTIGEWRGTRGPDRWLPHCLGHEGTGLVLECGSEVTRFTAGDRVVLSWIAGPGIDAGGTTYGQVSAGAVTTLQRLAVVSENRLTRLPECLMKDVGILLGCAAATGLGSILNVGKVRSGDRVIVIGCGAVGLHAVIAAKFRGAQVIAVDPVAERRDLALRFGALTTADYADIRPAADVVIVATGAAEAIPYAMAHTLPRGGRTVVIGNAPHGSTVPINPAELNAGKSLLGTWGGDTNPAEHFPLYAAIIATHDVHMMLSEPYALADTAKAFADLEAGRVCRPIIDMSL